MNVFKGSFDKVKNGTTLRVRCPGCHREALFVPAGGLDDLLMQHSRTVNPPVFLGQYQCPDSDCRTHVFAAWRQNGSVEVTYPAERIGFDATSIPDAVAASLSEAIDCHANRAYVAAAMMIRRTMEIVCEDRGASGANLHDRIGSLGKMVILPRELLDGLGGLRLLGNDAAHVEARVYSQIGENEIEVAIEVAKEVLKALYQLGDLVGRLEALKKTERPQ